jgi:dihydrofolate reductase
MQAFIPFPNHSEPAMKLHLIFARAANGVMGANGKLPWHLPEDMAHFKRITMGCPVIMGRKTWDSLPARFRPLPGRCNIVLTRQAHWQEAGACSANSVLQACALSPPDSDAWVIGGAEIYARALPLASSAMVTEIEADFEGDVFAPQFGPQWIEIAREPQVCTSGLHYSFVTYRNLSNTGV